MLNKTNKSILFFAILLQILFVGNAFCDMEVTSLHATTHEIAPSGPYNLTLIEMAWSVPNGYTKGQISKFVYIFTSSHAGDLTTASEIMAYTDYNENEDFINPDDFPGDSFSIKIPIEDFFDNAHLQYWFHVAAIGTGFPVPNGDTVHVGAYQIDIEAPTNPYIKETNDATSTDKSEITLKMSASKGDGGVFCVRYWFVNYGQKPTVCSEKNDFPFETTEELPEYDQGPYPKNYIVMAEFEDKAGNIGTTASYQIQYAPDSGKDAGSQTTTAKSIPTLNEWGTIFLFMLLVLSSVFVLKRRRCISDTIY
jgi:hypothetical protein